MQAVLTFVLFLPQWFGFLHKPETTQMTINLEQSSVRCSVMIQPSDLKPNEGKYYHWYKSYTIQRSRAGYSGRLLHGRYVSYFLDKNLYEKGSFKEGLKHGCWKEWYPSGELKKVEHFRKGYLHGTARHYNKQGELLKENRYKKDQLHGKQVTYSENNQPETVKYKRGEKVVPKVKPPKPKRIKQPKQKKEKTPKKQKEQNKKKDAKEEAISKKS